MTDWLGYEKTAKNYFPQHVVENGKRFLVFVRHKGQLVFSQLLRCESLAVDHHSGTPHALHLHKAKLVRKAG